MKTSIIDLPRKSSDPDTFGIDPYQKGLIKFINYSETPITIALQGEWGSGKTSLMNTLERDLCSERSPYYSIWLNTWEYALMKNPETALVGILSGLIEQIMTVLKQDESQTKRILWKLGKAVGSIATNVAITQANKAVDSAGDAFDAFKNSFATEGSGSIGGLRDDLEQTINSCIEKNQDGKKGVIFFIDDLDRIDPPVAVQLLELLKNIFSLSNCVFILAIDYDVVVKGLEPKFGKFCAANEREFRSFFDKIIQLPFSMPVSGYKIDSFLTESLQSIEYLNAEQAQDKELTTFITRAANFTVGNNPRALKRLLNSLSLISCINQAQDDEQTDPTNSSDDPNEESNVSLDTQVNFALVSLQVAYPAVYRMIDKKPAFDQWNEDTALEFNLERLTEDQTEIISRNEEFDEPWEHVVFQACDADLYLRKKSLSISRHLNSLKTLIENAHENVGEVVEGIISLSSITNVEAFDKPVINYHRGHLLKDCRWHLIEVLKEKLPDIADQIQDQGKRVQTNAYLKFTEKDWEHPFHLWSHPHDGKIRLRINTGYHLMNTNTEEEAQSQLAEFGELSNFEQIINDFKALILVHQEIENPFEGEEVYVYHKNNFTVRMDISVDLDSPDDLYKNTLLWQSLGDTVANIFKLRLRLETLKNKIEKSGT